jgi:hypothetical protein
MDLDDLRNSGPDHLSGEIALWMAVTIDAIFTLRDGGGYPERARGWIEDPENIFFEAAAEQLECTPGGLRERIREALKRSRGTNGKFQDRHW